MDPKVLREFLKSGYVYGGELFPPDDAGISLGSSISTILGNLTLDGMQKAIFMGLHGRVADIDFANGNMIRFADDVLITARAHNDAVKILKILDSFLAERGCRLSPEKTTVYDISDGFDFLSMHYVREANGIVFSTPSEAAVQKFAVSLQELILSYRGGQKGLIEKLNKKLNGWATYHKVTEAQSAFRYIDVLVDAFLIKLCEQRNPRLSRAKIFEKYFYREPNGSYVYALSGKVDVRVVQLARTILTEHTPVMTKMNPYLDTEYYETRTDERAIENVTGKFKTVWERQDGVCHYCGKAILSDQHRAVIPLDVTKRESAANTAYIHAYCALTQSEYYRPSGHYDLHIDLNEILQQMLDEEAKQPIEYEFDALMAYFHKKTDAVFTLKFDEISKILGEPLSPLAEKFSSWWTRSGEDKISECWSSNGYKIRKLHLEEKYIVFARDDSKNVPVTIPEVFLSGRVPPNARAELENFFEHIRKKYGL
jgi:RNA-directed DNA polymerase